MNRKEYAAYTQIPLRTLEDWEAGRRNPPAYVLRLLNYQILYDKLMKEKEE